MEKTRSRKITVLGSANYDVFMKVERAPEIGETISSNSLTEACGGKGANQAAAVGKLQHEVDFVGQLGNDSQGKILKSNLEKFGVNTKNVEIVENQPTGQAFILSYPNKDNSIIIVGGANMDWSQNSLKASLLLMQREVPEEINISACNLAKKYNVTTVLDVGGADTPLTNELLSLLDIISPNESELKRICGKEVDVENDKELIVILDEIREKSQNKKLEFLLKMGSKGAKFIDKENTITRQNAFNFKDFEIIDTTGAGDCFTASFSVELVKNKPIKDCMKFAAGCAFLCICSFGAMPSLPTSQEFEEKLRNRII